MRLFLGVDGGQSSTTAVIGDENGRILGSGRGGPCNHVYGPEGRPKFINAIGGCVGAASLDAGLDAAAATFEAACAGFSGGPADKRDLLAGIVRSGVLEVTTDAVIALCGATAGAPGIITIAGTGSISYGRNAGQKFARAGGWGYVFGDEGGGFDITRQALRAGSADANDLLHRFYTTDYQRPKIASLSKLVDRAAVEGDTVARNIMLNAAQQLATSTSAVRSQLFTEFEKASVAYIGGVFKSELVLERFRMLVELEDGNHVIRPRYEPAVGALIEAYRIAGLSPELSNVPSLEK
jgi:N-acetylglucosamine kinase-like BadF-type ATPase